MILTVLGFSLPLGAYLWFIPHYGVNVVWRDQWSDIGVISHSYDGTLNLGTLWAPHNENRLLFPNLLVVFLARTTHLNLFVEMYLSALLLVASITLFIWTHKRRSPSTPWLFYCPVAIVMLSFVQFENTLSGFQICWYLVLAALASTLFLLDHLRFGWFALTLAAIAAVIGSYSAIQGLFIWPVGLLVLFLRRRPPRFLLTWVAVATATAAVFFYHLQASSYGESTGSVSAAIEHPVLATKFFFLAIGDVVGGWIPWPLPWGGPNGSQTVSESALLLGVVIFVIAVWVVITHFERDVDGPSPIGLALIGFGLLFALSIASGRSSLIGLWYAGTSRYTTFDLLILVGSYLTILDRRPRRMRAHPARIPKVPRVRTGTIVAWSLTVIICVQVVLGIFSGLAGGRDTRQVGLATEDVILNIRPAPNSVVERIYFGPNIGFVRTMASVVEKRRLTFLASSAGRRVSLREGLDVGVWEGGTSSPVTPWRDLKSGEVVSISAQHFSSDSGPKLIVSECNSKALWDPAACDNSDAVTVFPRADGSIRATYTVMTGKVGDGTCERGRTCYIGVSSPHDPSLRSFAEITF